MSKNIGPFEEVFIDLYYWFDIKYRKLKIWYFWKIKPGVVIQLAWPPPNSCSCGDPYCYDPNQEYRPYIEKVIGCQLKHWDWRWTWEESVIKMKIHRSRAKYATILLFKWGL